MTTTRTRARRQTTETLVIKVPPRVYAAVKRLADAEYTTPRGYIERRLSEVAAREAEARQQMHEAGPSDSDSERSGSEPVNGYL